MRFLDSTIWTVNSFVGVGLLWYSLFVWFPTTALHLSYNDVSAPVPRQRTLSSVIGRQTCSYTIQAVDLLYWIYNMDTRLQIGLSRDTYKPYVTTWRSGLDIEQDNSSSRHSRAIG